jgi:hypothetical protein
MRAGYIGSDSQPPIINEAPMNIRTALAIAFCLPVFSCSHNPAESGRGTRAEKNGWIFVHLEGTPREIGRQHGELLAEEIDDALRMVAHFLQGSTNLPGLFLFPIDDHCQCSNKSLRV